MSSLNGGIDKVVIINGSLPSGMPTTYNLIWIQDKKPKDPNSRWEWPMALYQGPLMHHAAYIICEDPFDPIAVNSANHKELRVVMYRYGLNPEAKGRRMLSSERFTSLRQAIEFIEYFIKTHPDWRPRIF